MLKTALIIFLGGFVLGLTFYLAPSQSTPLIVKSLKKPEPAFDFTLKNFQEQNVSLKYFRGKIVFADFWASWCIFCQKEILEIEKIWREMKKENNLIILGIHRADTESKKQGEDFIKALGVTYPLLQDSDGLVYQTFSQGIQAMPLAIFIDKNGFVRERIFGPKTAEQMKKIIEKMLSE